MKNQKTKPIRKSIAVIGEGLTEYRYIESMRTNERYRFHLFPGVPKHSDINDMVALGKKRLNEGYDYVLCLVDMDVILSNQEKLRQYKLLQKQNRKIEFIESNPCTEYWFLMHYMPRSSSKEYSTYEAVAKELRKYIPDYDKSEEFFNKTDIYKYLKENSNMLRAIEMSRDLDHLRTNEPDVYKSYSQMYKLFDKILEITQKK